MELKVNKSLREAGMALKQARKAVDDLRDNRGEDLATANLGLNGTGSVLARNGDELIDILKNGQTVFSVVALGGVQEEVNTAIRDLRPSVVDTDEGRPPVSLAN